MPVPGYDKRKTSRSRDIIASFYKETHYFVTNVGLDKDRRLFLFLRNTETGQPLILDMESTYQETLWSRLRRGILGLAEVERTYDQTYRNLDTIQGLLGEKGGLTITRDQKDVITGFACYYAEGHPGIGSFVDGEVNLPQVVPMWATT
jgi:hypothetical protein